MGSIVTFYSFKGGVGRSMALANVAVLLARWGYKTLVVDWDLEAPGLENFFKCYFNNEEIEGQKGVVELLYSAQENVRGLDGASDGAQASWEERAVTHEDGGATRYKEWQDYLVSVKLKKDDVILHLLTAGRRDSAYFSKVRTFDVQEFYLEKQGGFFIEELRQEWKDAYDFILVDSRTGITDIGGICTIQLPDILVLLFTATEQGLNGAVDVARRATVARRSLPFDRLKLLTIPVPSRFDRTVEFRLADKWLHLFEEKVSDLYADWLPRDISRRDILELTKIPYQAFFSFGEKLAVEEGTTLDPTGIGHAYETLTALIANRLENAQRLRENRDEFVKLAATAGAKAHPVSDIDVEYLAAEFKRHKSWLASGKTDGKPADFSKRRLRGASFQSEQLEQSLFTDADLSAAYLRDAVVSASDFSGANLQGANLERLNASGANFEKAILIDAVLEGANLSRASLRNANMQGAAVSDADLRQASLEGANLARTNLKNARLRNASLENANVGDVIGLKLSQLGGTNLAGAKVPEQLLADADLFGVKRLIDYLQILLVLLVMVCAYSVYIVLGEASNLLLLTNGELSRLGFGIPLDSFFMAAPPVLFFLHFFFHYNLQRLWEKLGGLPAVFPDGETLDKKFPNWFVALMVRTHFRQLDDKSVSAILRLFFTFVGWWMLPVVLSLFWARYLPMNRWLGTSVHILWVAGAVGASIYFYELTVKTLSGDEDGPPPVESGMRATWMRPETGKP